MNIPCLILLPAFSILSLNAFVSLQAAEPAAVTAKIRERVNAEYASLEALYHHLHSNPELSNQEEQTAARMAAELKAVGCDVTQNVGGHGVVGVLRNGEGPVIMLRADMDGLPIVEETGLAYASKVKTADKYGRVVGVMHACGHDVNMTCLVGVARLMSQMKDAWQGTLLLIGQPAEEIGAGARQMIADGLFHKFPRPQYCLALHCDSRFAAGEVNYRPGKMQANMDAVDVLVRGKGGHGAAPHATVDPVVLAARIVLDLQTIVSRERSPLDPVVVTVGSIHGGTKHNVIPSEVKLQLTVRTTNDTTRDQVLASIERVAKAAAQSMRAPGPEVSVDLDQYTPSLENDPELSRRMAGVLERAVGREHVHVRPMSMGGEDFSRFVREGIPGFYYFLGSAPPERVKEAARENGRPLTGTHTSEYYPVPEPTIKTGVLTMTASLLDLLAK